MAESEKITIIEGPPPTFELASGAWALSLTEGSRPTRVVACRVRTFNGPSLVERCHQAWARGASIHLEYRSEDGLIQQTPIVAARWVEQPEGHVLLLWVRMEEDEIEFEIDFDFDDVDLDDFNDEFSEHEDDSGLDLMI